MKAIVVEEYGGPEALVLREVDLPRPARGELLIRVEAAAVNFVDTRIRAGAYRTAPPPPLTPGLEVCGVVEALGPDTEAFSPGQRVVAMTGSGGYAEYATAPANLTWSVPDEVDSETAAAFPTVGITAYHLLRRAGNLQPGETVLVHSAAGGVGSVAVQLARTLGAGSVLGTVGSEAKVSFARAIGCDHVFLSTREDFAQEVLQHTDGRGADLILDAVGGDVFAQSLDCLADFGRLVVYGTSGGRPGRLTSDRLPAKNLAVVGYSTGTLRRSQPQRVWEAGQALLEELRAGRLRIPIGARFPLADAEAAHRLLESRQSTGKILLRP